MDCELIGERLSHFHFGVVTREERAAVETHLAGCGGCLHEWFVFKEAVEEGARLDASPTRRFRAAPARYVARAAMAAGLVALLAGGAQIFLRARPADPPTLTAFDTADTGEARLATHHIF